MKLVNSSHNYRRIPDISNERSFCGKKEIEVGGDLRENLFGIGIVM